MQPSVCRFALALLILSLCSCSGQAQERNPQLIAGPCEAGCEAVYMYDETPTATDTLPDFDTPGPKLRISGTVYQPDGTTPAPGVVLYVYQTNREGIYKPREGETGWRRQHGYIRGWVKTDADGRYTFYTMRPASYPNSSELAHIHATLMEPDGTYYWIGSYVFDDDPLLTESRRRRATRSPRGGSSGILTLQQEGELQAGERDIILGRNVPGYE